MKILRKALPIMLVIIIMMSLIISGCGQKELTKIRLTEVTHSVFYAPMYVAIQEGFFKDEGLEVEFTNAAGSDKVMTAILSGSADVGLMGPEAAIYVYNQGKDDYVQMFAQITKRDGSFLMARKPDPNFKWEDLKGKHVIGGRKGGVPEMTLEYVIKKHGLKPGKDVYVDTSIQFALMAGAFKGGKGDYVTLFEPVASELEKAKAAYIVAYIGKDSGEIPYTGLAAKKSYIENNKETVDKITSAIYKGQLWVKSHSDEEVAKSLLSYFPDTSLDILTTVVKRYRDGDAWMTTPVMKKEAFEKLQEVMKTAGELDKKAPFVKVVNNTFAIKAVNSIK